MHVSFHKSELEIGCSWLESHFLSKGQGNRCIYIATCLKPKCNSTMNFWGKTSKQLFFLHCVNRGTFILKLYKPLIMNIVKRTSVAKGFIVYHAGKNYQVSGEICQRFNFYFLISLSYGTAYFMLSSMPITMHYLTSLVHLEWAICGTVSTASVALRH